MRTEEATVDRAVCFYLFNTVISDSFHEFLKSHFLKSSSHVMLDFGSKSFADMAAEHAVTTLRGYDMAINILCMHITHTHTHRAFHVTKVSNGRS